MKQNAVLFDGLFDDSWLYSAFKDNEAKIGLDLTVY